MHYKNGREAKNGDKVVLIPSWGPPMIGILYDAQAGNDGCNGKLAPIAVGDPCPTSVPDTSKPAPSAAEPTK